MNRLLLIPILFFFSTASLAHDWDKTDKLAWAVSLLLSHEEISKCGDYIENNKQRKFKKLCNWPKAHAENHNDLIAHYNSHKSQHPEMSDYEFIHQHFTTDDGISDIKKEEVPRRIWLEVHYFTEVQELLIQMYLVKEIIK